MLYQEIASHFVSRLFFLRVAVFPSLFAFIFLIWCNDIFISLFHKRKSDAKWSLQLAVLFDVL